VHVCIFVDLVKCDSSKPQDQCSIVEHRNWSDKHYVRGNTNAHVAKGGGWVSCLKLLLHSIFSGNSSKEFVVLSNYFLLPGNLSAGPKDQK